MPNTITRRVGLLLIVTVFLVPLFDADPAGAAHTRILLLPSTGIYEVGDQINVAVWIKNVTGLYGGDVRLSFDAARLEVVDANPSLPGVQILPESGFLLPDFVIRNQADNEAGTIWYAVTQVNPSKPVDGSGVFFSFTLKTLDTGLAPVEVQSWLLGRYDATEIQATAEGASYEVAEAKPRLFLPLVARNH